MLARIQPHAIVVSDRSDDHTVTPLSSVSRHARHSSWMLARLTLDTKSRHSAADEGLMSPFEDPTVGAYRHFLARMYGFSAPVGVALLSTPGLDAELLVPRVRTAWLASDLLGLGLTRTESAMLQRRLEVPAFRTSAAALGWLYVSERFTLRHELIRNRLRQALPDAFESACDYLMSTSGRVHLQWNELGRALDRAAVSEEVAVQILEGAHAAFDTLQSWIDWTIYDGF